MPVPNFTHLDREATATTIQKSALRQVTPKAARPREAIGTGKQKQSLEVCQRSQAPAKDTVSDLRADSQTKMQRLADYNLLLSSPSNVVKASFGKAFPKSYLRLKRGYL